MFANHRCCARRQDRSGTLGSVDGLGELLRVDATCVIDSDELEWRFEPAGGPGGQHANRAHTRAVASFDVTSSPSLTVSQRQRIASKLGPVVRAVADDERSQLRNR